jgi:hypothetical protein
MVYPLVERLSREQRDGGVKPATYVGSTPHIERRLREHNSRGNRTKKTKGRRWDVAGTTSSLGSGATHITDDHGRKTKNPAMTLARSFEQLVDHNRKAGQFKGKCWPRTRTLTSRFNDFLKHARSDRFRAHNIAFLPSATYQVLFDRSVAAS